MYICIYSGSDSKESVSKPGNLGQMPGLDPLENGMATYFHYSCLENSWKEEPGRLHVVYGVAKSQT